MLPGYAQDGLYFKTLSDWILSVRAKWQGILFTGMLLGNQTSNVDWHACKAGLEFGSSHVCISISYYSCV